MKIESGNYPIAAPQNGAQRGASSGDVKNAVESAQQDSADNAENAQDPTVSLSSLAALRPTDGSDIDMAKVASIKAALSNGSYTIDSSRIADGMLGSARDLLQTTAR
ncbi:flagellar biosynthesis anti-sigma factor FlgM [Paraburkholderia sp. BCC1886]|uniref:flagellar biosynthesis anti-sigma factor FlgM n=1 Tax=Paraburkholderia sp. BCC1886 TaxID=2562670 RepID=UPI00118454AE|nr:flagellar biosynthesis anti-sigma factor FlgM [Paraburkholderia sp. BCC1886]